MGIDYLYLEALRDVPRDALCRAVIEEMSAEGWRTASDPTGDVAIELVERGPWTVIHDVREKLPIEWAERLAHSLGVVAISARSWTDQGVVTVARFDGDARGGRLDFDARSRARAVKAAFLADLAPAKNRAKLRRGLETKQRRCDNLLEEIVALVGLPDPFTRYMFDTGGKMLRFDRRVRRAPDAASALRVRNVRFGTSYHVRDVAPDIVVAAIARVLTARGLHAVTASKKPARHVFERHWHGWTSFGEVIQDGEPIDWAKLLSRALRKPVLSVVVGDDWAELRVNVGASVASRVELFQDDDEVAVDPALLAPFGVKKKIRVRLRRNPFTGVQDPWAAACEVGAALGLDHAILAGRVKGRVLTFE